MVDTQLRRFCYLPKGSLSELTHRGEHVCWILERPWLNNAPFDSCIPDGLYDVLPDEEGRYRGHPEIIGVSGRSEIIIHAANRVNEIEGCLAPGTGYAMDGVEPYVTESRLAYGKLLMTCGLKFQLKIYSQRAEVE